MGEKRNYDEPVQRYGDRYNYEGYRDSTAEVAIRNVENERGQRFDKDSRCKQSKQKKTHNYEECNP